MAGEVVKSSASDLFSFGQGPSKLATSLDVTKRGSRKLLNKALSECDMRLTEQINREFKVKDFVIHAVTVRGKENGELADCTRLVLITHDEKTLECVSDTLVSAFQRLAWVYGVPPWEPPMKVIVRTKKKGERSIYWLEDASDDEPEPTSAKPAAKAK
jgi:hypothetical protein